MSIYRYQQSQSISDITFRTTENGSVRAYIHARDGLDNERITSALTAMRDKSYVCTPFLFEEKPMLEVRGFGKEGNLLETLKSWLGGKPKIDLEPADKLSWSQWFKKRTLQLSGITYLVGDIGFFSYGYKEADKLVMAASISYFLGTLSLVFYGRNDQSDLQIKDLSKELASFLCHEGKPAPKDSALHAVLEEKEKSLLQSAHEFGKRYPSEIFNTVTAIAGLFIAASSYKKLKAPTHGMDAKSVKSHLAEAKMDIGLGVLTALSGTFATLVKEKNPDPDTPPKQGLAWLWEKIQAHPLAIAGGGYSIATLCHAVSTYTKYKNAKRINDQKAMNTVLGRAVFVGAALASEALLAISSKGHGEGVVSDYSVDTTALAIAADFIARQPQEQQQQLIEATTKFLADEKHLALKDEDTARLLFEQVEAANKNPWMQNIQKMKPVAVPAIGTAPAPISVKEPAKEATMSWQAKMAASQAVSPVLGV